METTRVKGVTVLSGTIVKLSLLKIRKGWAGVSTALTEEETRKVWIENRDTGEIFFLCQDDFQDEKESFHNLFAGLTREEKEIFLDNLDFKIRSFANSLFSKYTQQFDPFLRRIEKIKKIVPSLGFNP